jgi:hypothetical protein
MLYLIYFVVAVVTAFSVLFEMNILVEPPRKAEQAVAAPGQPVRPVAQRIPVATATANASAPAPEAAASQFSTARSAQMQSALNKCDATACAATYHSFRASDCTYQPDEGPRRLCDKGVPSDPASAEAVLNAHADASAANASPLKCNVSACEQAYVSFSRADCTYQPLEGARRLCAK